MASQFLKLMDAVASLQAQLRLQDPNDPSSLQFLVVGELIPGKNRFLPISAAYWASWQTSYQAVADPYASLNQLAPENAAASSALLGQGRKYLPQGSGLEGDVWYYWTKVFSDKNGLGQPVPLPNVTDQVFITADLLWPEEYHLNNCGHIVQKLS